MPEISNEELITMAESVIDSRRMADFYIGDVGCALVSRKGDCYLGVCIGGYLGICAEQAAIGAMVTAGELTIERLVAVWKDENGRAHVVPPCGRCREFMRLVHTDNLEAEIVLGAGEVWKLRELLPHHRWFA